MPRLLSDSDGFAGVTGFSWLSGPNARNSGSTTAMDGSEQTFDAYGDVVALEFTLNVKRDVAARRQAGVLTALRGGNAMRLRFFDPDMMKPYEAGINVSERYDWTNLPTENWSNGMPWSNGAGWALSAPVVPVAASAGFDTGIVRLGSAFWGHQLGLGDIVGFFPFHFGIYTVTEVIDDGEYRIWPRLRKALTSEDFCTLHPTIVMRPVMNTLPPGRGLAHTDAATVSLVEVTDYYVRDYYEG